MADNGLMVTISGAALSLLFYENARSMGDQMGFFLGEVLQFVTKNVTDSERQVESVKVHVDIQSILPCSHVDQIYDTSGKIHREKLKELVRDKGKRIVGWFRFRRNSSLVPTLRDKIVHKQLLSIFRGSNNPISDNCFVACMLNSSTSNRKGTHKFKHVFLHYKHGMYHPLPLRINNLGDDAARHDGSDYKPTPTKFTSEPDAFTKFVKTLNLDLAKTPGVESVRKIQKAAEQQLERLVPKVVETDQEVSELEHQVTQSRLRLVNSFVQKHQRSLAENYPPESKYRIKKETDNEQRSRFFKNEESTSRSSRVLEDSWTTKDSTVPTRPKGRHSVSAGVNNMSNTIDQVKYPAPRISYSQMAKKSTDRGHDGSDTDC